MAEDEPVSQRVAAMLLGRAGHAVTVVGDGRAALEAVRGERFDLVLMDLRMPEMDGAEAARRIRALPDRARVRIVMLTASAIPEDRDLCHAAGADAVVEKPLRLDTLQPVLERLFAIDGPLLQREPAGTAPPDFNLDAIRQMREHLPAERVSALIGGTVATLRQYQAALADAWAAGDSVTVGSMAHKIAGVAGIYGCMALRAAAQELERAVETGDGDAAALRRQLDDAFTPALAMLETQRAGLAGA
nr:response regulator [Azospirillum soli]